MSKEFCRLYLTSTSGVWLSPQAPLVFPQNTKKTTLAKKTTHWSLGHCMLRTALHSQQQQQQQQNRPPKMRKTRPAGEAQGQGVTVMASRVERGVLAFATS
jgi:hypothetical protein